MIEGAIGAVFTTDVLSFYFEGAKGIGYGNSGILDVAGQRTSAKSAIASFSELAKLAIATELDIDPEELKVGRQRLKARVGQIEVDTEQIFMADKLENGAGYTRWASKPSNFRKAIENFYSELEWDKDFHSLNCDRSCPDCLQSYSNRFMHGLLDWRLALDLTDLALGNELNLSRWIEGAEDKPAEFFVDFCKKHGLEIEIIYSAGLTCLINGQKAHVLGHPLWHTGAEGLWQPKQLEARDELRSINWNYDIQFIDVRDFVSQPAKYFMELRA